MTLRCQKDFLFSLWLTSSPICGDMRAVVHPKNRQLFGSTRLGLRPPWLAANDELLNQWVAEDDHQIFLDALAPYRSQDYAVKLDDAGDPPQSLDDWQKIPKDN